MADGNESVFAHGIPNRNPGYCNLQQERLEYRSMDSRIFKGVTGHEDSRLRGQAKLRNFLDLIHGNYTLSL